jgi:riboflavin synthase
VNGVCLTVLQSDQGWFTVAAMTETISRTAVGEWETGRRVNLERALRADARLGGHIVQGHVDGVGTVAALTRNEDSMLIDVAILPAIAETLVLHGSVAIDGVSLTVNRLEGDKLQVALIEHTSRNTTLGELSVGAKVHVETDIVGKYVRRLVAPYLKQ